MMRRPLPLPVQASARPGEPPPPTFTWAQRQEDLKKAKDDGYIEGFRVKGLALFVIGVYCGALGTWLINASGVFR
jgi:hypothetical protein